LGQVRRGASRTLARAPVVLPPPFTRIPFPPFVRKGARGRRASGGGSLPLLAPSRPLPPFPRSGRGFEGRVPGKRGTYPVGRASPLTPTSPGTRWGCWWRWGEVMTGRAIPRVGGWVLKNVEGGGSGRGSQAGRRWQGSRVACRMCVLTYLFPATAVPFSWSSSGHTLLSLRDKPSCPLVGPLPGVGSDDWHMTIYLRILLWDF